MEKDLTPVRIYKDGEPCKHAGCLNHRTKVCEGCGRISGQGEVHLPKYLLDVWENGRKT